MTLERFCRQYGEQLDPPNLSFPPSTSLLSPSIQSTLYNRLFNDTTVWPQPPIPYQTRVLKTLIARIEEAIADPEEDEITDALLEKWTSLLSHPKPDPLKQAQQLTYISYTAPTPFPGASSPFSSSSQEEDKARTILTSESRGLILASGTTGFRTWEAALHLGTYLSTTAAGSALITGNRVIELGAGTGFVSLFCAKYLGPRRIVATDREPALVDCMVDCAARNEVDATKGGMFEAGIWEWGMPVGVSSSVPAMDNQTNNEEAVFDVALGADLIYDTDLIPLLVSTIDALFTTHKIKQFVISATLRNEDTFQAFLNACEQNGLKTDRIPFESPAPEHQTGFFHSTSIPISIYQITK
ncbi:hypothetical protein FE257_011440 [Aspergillus nanangensis]|uniref:Methyltransferase-domain-containing protein n=1 Tax=Aspergillus nanangensis TaxID=2582783 RepID=A0AAD4GSH6_ASPNN|nr:hypothetical protein FE257_011440 [Aspergillus nanangensis]